MGSDRQMPFGRHSGVPICLLPTEYLDWCRRNLRNPAVRQDAEREYEFRQMFGRNSYGSVERDGWFESAHHPDDGQQQVVIEPDTFTPPPEVVPQGIPEEVITKWMRSELIRYHPDRNAQSLESKIASQTLSSAFDRLRKLLE